MSFMSTCILLTLTAMGLQVIVLLHIFNCTCYGLFTAIYLMLELWFVVIVTELGSPNTQVDVINVKAVFPKDQDCYTTV